jgi:hypothetical protein
MTPAQLKKALAAIVANTKRLEGVSFTARKPRKSAKPKRKPVRTAKTRAKYSKFYSPPRAPEPVVEPYFAPPAEPVAAKAPVTVATGTPKRTTRQPEASESIPLPPPSPFRGGFKTPSTKDSSPSKTPSTGGFMPRELRLVGSCKAVCALTGRPCRLPAHRDDVSHANERGPFRLVAVPGQTHFAHRDALESAALAGRRESDPDEAAAGRYATSKKAREKYRAKKVRLAHDGAETTTGLEGHKRERAAYRVKGVERDSVGGNHG